ncbi:MAG: phosphotriesterase-related protein [Chloroflexi bacterium]|nr:phosphotriesterase-related protein [Chloroflexota bacterium]
MTDVVSVLGPVPAEKLGVTLTHEHMILDLCRVTRDASQILNEVPLAVKELGFFSAAGGASVVEVTNRGLGRDPLALAEIARLTGLNVIMGAGWYREPFYDRSIYERTTNEIADEIVRDVTVGVDAAGIRAGIIGEIGADLHYVSPAEERVLRAAARAHQHTGVTITTHGVRSPVGLAQLDILEDEGVDLRRVIIGHCDFYPHPDFHLAVARRGAFVQFDSIGRGFYEWDVSQRLDWVLRLIGQGFLQRILLSHDVCMKPHLHAYGGQGYDYVLTSFVPRLREAGLSPAQIHTLTVDNPRSALTGERQEDGQ